MMVGKPSFKDVQKVFLGQKKYLQDNNTIVTPAVYFKDKAQMQRFYSFLKVSERQYKSIWRRKMFGGLGIPPQQFKNKNNLQEFFDDQKNAVVILLSVVDDLIKVKYVAIND